MKDINPNILLFAILLCTNCSDDSELTTYHGLIDKANQSNIVKLELTNYNTFNELVDRIEQISCNDRVPTISIKNDNEETLLGLANPCWEGVACIHIKKRNVLKIKDEKIRMTNEVTIDSLEIYMARHYSNNGEFPQFSESPNKALISITYEQKEMKNLKIILINILNNYSMLDLDLPLIVSLDKQIPPPPPTPLLEYETSK